MGTVISIFKHQFSKLEIERKNAYYQPSKSVENNPQKLGQGKLTKEEKETLRNAFK